MLKFNFITVCWGLFALVWTMNWFSVKPAKERQQWFGQLVTTGFISLTFILLYGKFPWRGLDTHIWPVGHWFWIVGCIITFTGLAIAIWSRFSLGSNWSATVTYREGHELVERGPYRFVRHPIYTGFLMMIFGTAFVLGNISGVIAFAICSTGIWWKLRTEEAMLSRHFPDAYPQYKSHTKVIVPFIL